MRKTAWTMVAQMQKRKWNAALIIGFFGLLIVLIITRTPDKVNDQGSVRAAGIHEIHPRFQEFHKSLGGTEIIGEGISPLFVDSFGNEYQYVMNALLVYSPNESPDKLYQLAALGMEFGVSELPLSEIESNSDQIRNGHPISEHFTDAYYSESIQGNIFGGEPISDASFYEEEARLVQYFENIGFYLDINDESAKVKLLPYGLWKCAQACGFTPENALPIVDESDRSDNKVSLVEQYRKLFPGEEKPDYFLFAPIAYGNDSDPQAAAQADQQKKDIKTSIESQKVPVGEINLKTWTATPLLDSSKSQTIMIGVFNKGQALADYGTEVRIWMPDGNVWKFYPETSGEDGRTNLVLNPIEALNGTRIVYQVCPQGATSDDQCLIDDFLIWEN